MVILTISIALLALKSSVEKPSTSLSQEKKESLLKKDNDLSFYNYVVKSVNEAMMKSADPCNNFYEYACGRWKYLPKGLSYWSNTETMIADMAALFHEQLTTANQVKQLSREYYYSNTPISTQYLWSNAQPFIVDLVSTYYNACRNETMLTSLGADPLKQVLSEMDDLYNSKVTHPNPLTTLQDILKYIHHKMAIHPFFGWKVAVDVKNSNKMTIELQKPTLDPISQGTNIEGDHELLTIYKQYTKNLLQIIGTYKDNDLDHETEIIDLLKTYQTIETYQFVNVTNITELNSLAPFLNWTTFFNQGLHNIGTSIAEDERIISGVQDHLKNLSREILSEIKRNGSQRLYIYLRWQVIQYYSQFLHQKARNFILPLITKVSGGNVEGIPKYRYRPCFLEVKDKLQIPMTYLLLEIYKNVVNGPSINKEITKVKNMSMEIRKTYEDHIASFNWLTKRTKDILLKKLSSIKILVGYPPITEDIPTLKSLYAPLQFKGDNLLQNQIQLLKFNQEKNMRTLHQPDSYTDWELKSPLSSVTYYSYRTNTIAIPVGEFRYPLYSSRFIDALSYARMAMFIAHEIGHAIDTTGLFRDHLGQGNQILIDILAKQEYLKRVKCRINYYHQHYYPVKVFETTREILADDGSIRTVYQSIKDQLQISHFPTPLQDFMDEINLSPDQLFFLYFAQFFCTSSPPGVPIRGLSFYPPKPIRVQATLANTPEFHQAFNCSLGSRMNPIRNKTCDIW